ncbi:MAG: FimB/Mfa2 family fimbrial subunit [Prevotellaceae bacterium]|nr:FimB/Mfa2 family fimbrial subunit [Prevotellaceae bacterium]
MKTFKTKMLLLATMCAAMVSCDSVIYDDEGDCSTKYSVKFRYDMNMEYADAFEHEVQTVTLCAFDTSGVLAYTKTESAATLCANNQTMDVNDIAPGVYTFLAWAEGEQRNADSYTFSDMTVGQTSLNDINCKINRTTADDGTATVSNDLTPLFHGMVTRQDFTALLDGGQRTAEIDLTKNTNVVRVVLQHLSGENINVNDFSFTITDSNGWMNYDNSLISDVQLTYKPWSVYSGTAGINTDSEEGQTSVSAAIAEFTVGRLVYGNNPILTVYNNEGNRVLAIPLIDYALLVKGNYNSNLDNQEYLDREDEYAMTFFLDDDNNWISSSIIINSWRVVLQDFEM